MNLDALRGRFRVTESTFDLREAFGPATTCVDVQLVDDLLAADRVFCEEESEWRGEQKRWVTLEERIGATEIGKVRAFVAALLVRLADPSDQAIWFADGLSFTGDIEEKTPGEMYMPESFYSIFACTDEMRVNGRVGIFEVDRDQLGSKSRLFGKFFRVRGLATHVSEQNALASVLSKLTLLDPVPSTGRVKLTKRPGAASLKNLLPGSRFFFEELLNGTRLRIVSNHVGVDTIDTAVSECIGSLAVE